MYSTLLLIYHIFRSKHQTMHAYHSFLQPANAPTTFGSGMSQKNKGQRRVRPGLSEPEKLTSRIPFFGRLPSDVIFARPQKMLELALYTQTGLETYFNNWQVPPQEVEQTAPLLMRFNVLPEPQAQLFFSNLPRIYNFNLFNSVWTPENRGQGTQVFLDRVDLAGNGTIVASLFQSTNSTYFFTKMNINAMNFVFNDNQLQHSMINLTGHATALPAKAISINRNTMEVSTLFLDAIETSQVHYNSFIGSASTVSGLLLPPIMNLYINSYDSSIFQGLSPREPPGLIDARCNFWNKASGPSTCCNPEGQGSPVLWMTDFSHWCLDSNCSLIQDGPTNLNHSRSLPPLQSMPSCYYESYCAPSDQNVLWSIVGIEIATAIVGLCTCVVFGFSKYPDPYMRWKRMATTVRVISFLNLNFPVLTRRLSTDLRRRSFVRHHVGWRGGVLTANKKFIR